MPKFVTIGYGDQAFYDLTDVAVRYAAHAYDVQLLEDGAQTGRAGSPIQVRNHDGSGVITMDRPFMSSALPVAGFAIIEAATLAEAIDIVSKAPSAVAQGVVEVWPLHE